MLFTFYTYECSLEGILRYVICLHEMSNFANYVDKLMSSPFYEVFFSFGFKNAYTKLMNSYKTSKCMDVFLDFVATLKDHECFYKANSLYNFS